MGNLAIFRSRVAKLAHLSETPAQPDKNCEIRGTSDKECKVLPSNIGDRNPVWLENLSWFPKLAGGEGGIIGRGMCPPPFMK